MLKFLLPFLVVFPSIATAQMPLSDPTIGPAVYGQFSPAIASNGREAYAVWLDLRNGLVSRLFGSPIRAGDLTAPVGEPLLHNVTHPRRAGRPAIVWNGSHFLVVAEDGYGQLEAGRVDPAGTIVGPAAVRITENELPSLNPFALSNGKNTLVFSRDSRGSVLLLDDELQRLAVLPVSSLGIEAVLAQAATDGEDYLIVSAQSQSTMTRFVRISARGEVLSTATFLVPPLRLGAALVWTGTEYLLLWTDFYRPTPQPGGKYGIFGLRIERSGKPIGEPVTLVDDVRANSLRAAGLGNGRALIVFDQSANQFDHDLFAFTTDGTTSSESRKFAQIYGFDPAFESLYAIATSSGGATVALTTRAGIDVLELNADGEPLTPFQGLLHEETRSAPAQKHAAVDRHGPATMVLWEEQDGATPERIVIRPLNLAALPIREARDLWPSSRRQRAPAITRGASHHLAVWYEWHDPFDYAADVLAVRINDDGTRADVQPLLLGVTSANPADYPDTIPLDAPPAVVWDGSVFLVAFPAARSGTLRISRITADRVLLDPEAVKVADPTSGPSQYKPAFASIAGVTMLVWQEGWPLHSCVIECVPPPPGMIRALRFGPGGFPLDSAPQTVSDQPYSVHPDIASDGVRALITWSRSGEIFARRLFRDGSSPDEIPIFLGSGTELARPSVSALPDRFAIAWPVPQKTSAFDLVAVATVDAISGNSKVSVITPSPDRRRPWLFTSNGRFMIGSEHYTLSEATEGVGRLVIEPVPDRLSRRRSVKR